jgi:hypothetical protein
MVVECLTADREIKASNPARRSLTENSFVSFNERVPSVGQSLELIILRGKTRKKMETGKFFFFEK